MKVKKLSVRIGEKESARQSSNCNK